MSKEIQSFDDVLPNDGSAFDASFTVPDDQVREERAAKDKAASYLPIVDELIADLENDLAEADSISKSGITSAMPQIQVQIIMEGNRKFMEKTQVKLDAYRAMKEAAQG